MCLAFTDEQKHNFISIQSIIEFQSRKSFNIIEPGFDLAAGKKSTVQINNGCNNKTINVICFNYLD